MTRSTAIPRSGLLLAGSREFVDAARRMRQRLGGGWRQGGIFAAAGLVALDMVDRLAEDHARARRLATGLQQLGLGVRPEDTDTNIVHVETLEALHAVLRRAQDARPAS